jgi:hypothetical protein
MINGRKTRILAYVTSSRIAFKKVPIAKPSEGFKKIVLAGMEKAVPKKRLKTPIQKIKKFKIKVRTNKKIMRAFSFLITIYPIIMNKNRIEKFPKNALISPKNVCLKGAMYLFNS